MYRRIRTAAFAVAITVLLSGLALAQPRDDDKDYNNHKDRQHESKRDHDRDHDRDRDRNRDRDDHRWRDRDDRDGNWRNQGAYGNRGWRRGDGDADDRYRGNQGYYGNYPYGNNYPYGRGRGYGNNNPGYSQGYQEGLRTGQSDMARGKQFNPNPRGDSKYSDRGYRSVYGNKGAYQVAFLRGYEVGYRAGYRGGYGGYGRY
jgi:hypothetical protein